MGTHFHVKDGERTETVVAGQNILEIENVE